MKTNKLREIRQAQKRTLTEVALSADVPVSNLSLIERGQRCSRQTAEKLSDALHVSIFELFPQTSFRRY